MRDQFGILAGGQHGQQHDELVAADARDGIDGPHRAAHACRGGSQHGVSGRVPMGVVDLLEAIEVDEQQRAAAAAARGRTERHAQPVEQQRARRQSRQRVVHRACDQLGLDALAVRRILQRAAQLAGIELPLDHVVLGAADDGSQPELLVVVARQHDDRDVVAMLEQRAERLQALAVGEVEVKQHAAATGTRQQPVGAGARGGLPHELRQAAGGGLLEHQLHEAGVAGVVLDEQHVGRRRRHAQVVRVGSSTLPRSQCASISRTSAR